MIRSKKALEIVKVAPKKESKQNMNYHKYEVGQQVRVAHGQAPEKGYNKIGVIVDLIPWAYLVKIDGVEYSKGNEDIAASEEELKDNRATGSLFVENKKNPNWGGRRAGSGRPKENEIVKVPVQADAKLLLVRVPEKLWQQFHDATIDRFNEQEIEELAAITMCEALVKYARSYERSKKSDIC